MYCNIESFFLLLMILTIYNDKLKQEIKIFFDSLPNKYLIIAITSLVLFKTYPTINALLLPFLYIISN